MGSFVCSLLILGCLWRFGLNIFLLFLEWLVLVILSDFVSDLLWC